MINAWHNLWLNSLFIDSENDDEEFTGFHTDPVKAKANELLLFAKAISTENEKISEENVVDWMSNSQENLDQYQMTDNEIIENVLNPAKDSSSSDDDDLDNSKKNKI